ncbi:hypothetical protein D3C87_1879220 [compost metagenome]
MIRVRIAPIQKDFTNDVFDHEARVEDQRIASGEGGPRQAIDGLFGEREERDFLDFSEGFKDRFMIPASLRKDWS